MKVPFLDMAARYRPYRDRMHDVLDRVLDHGQAVLGPEVEAFERAVARYVGCGHAIAVGNGTDALVLGLKALGVTSGEVITTPMSYLASTSAIVLAGATPVFADVGADLNLSVDAVARAIGPASRAILVVHLAGNPAAMREFQTLARRHALYLIEDCAQAFGAEIGAKVGNLGDIGAVSFHPLKTLGAVGDAGAIFTNSERVATHLRMARNHGHSSREQCEFWSVNSRLDALQAGFLLAMMEDIDSVLEHRRRQAKRYIEGLTGVVQFPAVNHGAKPSYNFMYILASRRDDLRAFLAIQGIDTRIHYPIPIHRLESARGLAAGPIPNADAFTDQLLSLPLGTHLVDSQIDHVIESIRRFHD
ncbi:MAG: DegT/DnrJ/EryC1/StrS family aminotransferase [Rhodospirillaceae bacterium]|nr:DegT/DnrJ/EryC1/StrS family aminotransferase [Rhodospirillaceae bacterium]